jgi:UDP-3-O-[3-hydroxymyristoyl] glucosamine N-acyltransferase
LARAGTPDFALGDIAGHLGGELIGDPALRITRIGPLDGATPSTISFLSNPRYQSKLAQSQAGCVIVATAMRDAAAARGAAIVLDDPYLGFARLTQWWAARTRTPQAPGVHPSAAVDASARLGVDVSIGPFAVVEAGAEIGDRAVIGAHGVVGTDAAIGADTRLAPRVVIGAGCRIGARGIVHGGVVIGADGFGFAPVQGRWEKIEQLGAVRIGDDVEIGANTCIDRGALDDTVIADGVKLDNLIQIGHNVRIGAHTAMAGCVGIAGSATIGAHCTVGGGAIVLGHLTLADHVHISAASVVMRSIQKPGQYSGVFPIDDNASWEKNAATLRQLHGLRERLRALEKKP